MKTMNSQNRRTFFGMGIGLSAMMLLMLSGCKSSTPDGATFTAAEKKEMMTKPDPAHPPQAMIDFMKKANTGEKPSGTTKSPWSK